MPTAIKSSAKKKAAKSESNGHALKVRGLSDRAKKVLQCLKKAGEPLNRNQIATKTGITLAGGLHQVIGCPSHYNGSLQARGFVEARVTEKQDKDGNSTEGPLEYVITTAGKKALEADKK